MEWELATGKNTWSDELWKLYGLEPRCCEPSYNVWLQTIHSDDRASVESALHTIVQQEKELNLEWRIAMPSGKERWLMSRGRPIRNEAGYPTHYLGVVMDITESKLVEAEAVANRAKLAAALASMTDAVFISDAQGRFIDFNDAFATFHKFKSKDQCATTFDEYPQILEVYLPNGELAPVDQWAVSRALRGETVANAEYSLRRKDTGESWIGSYSFAPIRNQEGAIVGSVVTDVTSPRRSKPKRLCDSATRSW